MADTNKIKNEAIATIDAALTILNKFPEFDETNISLSYNTSFNPFDFLMDLFKSTIGYDKFLDFVSSLIVLELPAIEIAVKTVLITNFKNLISCTLNPIISDEVILNGFTFNLEEIDILKILKYSPLANRHGKFWQNPGKYYYFGCDNITVESDLKTAGDFNAFLWYVKTKSIEREVWTGVPAIQATFGDEAWGRNDYIQQQPIPSGDGEPPVEPFYNTSKKKCNKSAGILTLEFNERGTGLTDAEGNANYDLRTPYNNCIHVFIGNTAPVKHGSIINYRQEIKGYETHLEELKNELYKKQDQLENLIEANEDANKQDTIKGKKHRGLAIAADVYYKASKAELETQINSLKDEIKQTNINKLNAEKDLNEYLRHNDSVHYRSVSENYYHNRTIMEFNTDYIMSLKLFDAKVVTAQLIDALTACLSVDLNLSYEQLFIQNEIQKMVKAINETDDIVVNDCFFTFSNTESQSMLKRSELIRAGLFSVNGEINSAVEIDAESLLRSLNEINPESSKEEMTTIISGALTEISKMVSSKDYEVTDQVNFNVQMNFIEKLLSNLAYVITSAVISPKLYILLGINLQMLGRESNFDLAGFVDMYKEMLVTIIRKIRDVLIEKLVEKLYEIVGYLAEEIGQKIAIEQILYYKEQIRRCIECFRLWGRERYMDFDVNNIDYADIIQDEKTETETNKNC